MKIPTLLGIALIITLIALSGMYYYYIPRNPPGVNMQITDLKSVNISDTSAVIVWQTSSPTHGQVIYSSQFQQLSETASDARDRVQIQPRQVHFVTINKLKPNTRYNYKIKNDGSTFPQTALEFKTANFEIPSGDDLTFSFIKPVKGTILNTNLNPISESLIFLKIPGASDLATFSSTAGNFVMPLRTVLNTGLDKLFIIPPGTAADLTIVKGALKSSIKIVLDEDTVNLPPVPIGSNLDLTHFQIQPLSKITFNNPPPSGSDFNGDSKVNSLDLAMLREAAKPGSLIGTDTRSKFDINGDGLVDQKDIEEFSRILTGN